MLQVERDGWAVQVRRGGQRPSAVLDGGAGHGYAGRAVGVPAGAAAACGAAGTAEALLELGPGVPLLSLVVVVLESPVLEAVRAACVVHAAPP